MGLGDTGKEKENDPEQRRIQRKKGEKGWCF